MSLFQATLQKYNPPTAQRCLLVLLTASFCTFNSLPLAAMDWELEKHNVPTAGSRGNEYRLSGSWPNSCVPELLSITTRLTSIAEHTASVIELTSHSKQVDCTAEATAFSIITSLPENTHINLEFYWLHRDSPETDPRLLGFRLFSQGNIAPDIRPASGWWWPESGTAQNSGPGTGMTVDFQNGLLTLLTQAFDHSGQPEWLLGTAPLVAGIYSSQLIKFAGGQTLTGKYAAPLISHSRNAAHIRFLSASRALVWLETRSEESLDQAITLRQLTMVRYIMNPPVIERLLIGRWLLVAEDQPDYASQAQQFRIHSISINSTEASLQQTDGSKIGSCQLRAGKTDSPPISCEIQITGSSESWTFQSFSLERMRGKNQDRGRVTAFKVSSY